MTTSSGGTMRKLLSFLRRLGGDDCSRAYQAECKATATFTKRDSVHPRFREEMQKGAADPSRVPLGTAARERKLEVTIPLEDLVGGGHALVLGGSGSGKTRCMASVALNVLERVARDPDSLGFILVDFKGEFTALMKRLLGNLIDRLPSRIANRLIDRYVVVNPFSRAALPPLQILKPEPGMDPEEQAYDAATVIERMSGAALGVKQDEFCFFFLLFGILGGYSLPMLAEILSTPGALATAAAASTSSRVRGFFAPGVKLSAASLDGVRARLNALLRLPSSRLMLGAKSCISFSNIVASKVAFIDVGSPPFGSEDIARFFGGWFTLKLHRALFERSEADLGRPVLVMVDEFQEGLAAAGVAEQYERVLMMVRSKAVGLALVTQGMAAVTKVSAALPKIIETNCPTRLLFRSSEEDARNARGMLQLTGRRPRGPTPPWADAPRSPFMTPEEEREALIQELTHLPLRHFYFLNRRTETPAELVRAKRVEPAPVRFRSKELAWRLENGALAAPVKELERAAAEKAAAPAKGPAIPDAPAKGPTRRPKKPTL